MKINTIIRASYGWILPPIQILPLLYMGQKIIAVARQFKDMLVGGSKMKIEILFIEVCSLYGDHGNIMFRKDLWENNVNKTSILEHLLITEKLI